MCKRKRGRGGRERLEETEKEREERGVDRVREIKEGRKGEQERRVGRGRERGDIVTIVLTTCWACSFVVCRALDSYHSLGVHFLTIKSQ